ERALRELEGFAGSGPERLLALALRGHAYLRLGEHDNARSCLAELPRDGGSLALDFSVLRVELEAELSLLAGDAQAALAALEGVATRARKAGQEPLIARLEVLLSD